MSGTGKIIRLILYRSFLCLIILVPAAIIALALWYQAPFLREIIVGAWIVYSLLTAMALQTHHRRVTATVFVLVLGTMLLWWSSILPRSDRDWVPEVGHLVSGEVNGNIATLHNVRNFNWRTPTDYDIAWETRSYNLDEITGVDLVLSYWGMPAIAHTLISFEFKNSNPVVFSVEIRKEKGEKFSNIAGFFKDYELALIAADERDIVRLRTNVREPREDVYLYPLTTKSESRKKLFLKYVDIGNKLNAKPAFYNTVTANCTTVVYAMAQSINPGLHADPRVLLSGYLPWHLYEIGGLDNSKSIEQTIADAKISDKALAAGDSSDFSQLIRMGEKT
jgi:hypothetical protein